MNTQKPKHLSIAMLITLSAALFGLTACTSEPKPLDRESYDRESYERQQKAAQQSDRALDREVQKLNP